MGLLILTTVLVLGITAFGISVHEKQHSHQVFGNVFIQDQSQTALLQAMAVRLIAMGTDREMERGTDVSEPVADQLSPIPGLSAFCVVTTATEPPSHHTYDVRVPCDFIPLTPDPNDGDAGLNGTGVPVGQPAVLHRIGFVEQSRPLLVFELRHAVVCASGCRQGYVRVEWEPPSPAWMSTRTYDRHVRSELVLVSTEPGNGAGHTHLPQASILRISSGIPALDFYQRVERAGSNPDSFDGSQPADLPLSSPSYWDVELYGFPHVVLAPMYVAIY
jgi:hypothetical protein